MSTLTEDDRRIWMWLEKGPANQELLDEFTNSLTDEERQWIDRQLEMGDDLEFFAMHWHFIKRSAEQARRLGHEPLAEYYHPFRQSIWTSHSYVLVDEAHGYENAKAMAEKWGFRILPTIVMGETLDSRRDGDALIGLMGDDRTETYAVVVSWAPEKWKKESFRTRITEFENYQ